MVKKQKKATNNLSTCNCYVLSIACYLFSGVGENRTLVQISHQRAFYILSTRLIFVVKLTEHRPFYA